MPAKFLRVAAYVAASVCLMSPSPLPSPSPGDGKDRSKVVASDPARTADMSRDARASTMNKADANVPTWLSASTSDCIDRFDLGACTLVASFVVAGEGSSLDVSLAAAYRAQLCELGDGELCKEQGRTIERPFPVATPPPLDAPLTGPAAEMQIYLDDQDCQSNMRPAACYLAAALLLNRNAKGDLERATTLLRRSCDARDQQGCLEKKCALEHNDQSCVDAATNYLDAGSAIANPGRGRFMLAQACSRGSSTACAARALLPLVASGPAESALRSSGASQSLLFTIAAFCDRGIGGHCRMLARSYYYGLGVKRDVATAESLWIDACNKQDAQSCIVSGRRISERDEALAKPYFARAFALNQTACGIGLPPEGCFELAEQYLSGEGTAIDKSKALELLNDACGFWKFGWMCRRYHEVHGDILVAGAQERSLPSGTTIISVSLARECDSGGAFGCDMLGKFYTKGEGVPKDSSRAVLLFKAACTPDFSAGCTDLANLERLTGGTVGAASLCTTFGDNKSCLIAGDAANQSNDVAMLDKAAAFYNYACARQETLACQKSALIGDRFRTGDGVAVDRARAEQLYRAPCSVTHYLGCTGLIELANAAQSQGESGEDLAVETYVVACGAGYQPGCDDLWAAILRHKEPAEQPRQRSLWRRVCETHGFIIGACGNYAVMLETGGGGSTDKPTALQYYDRDCAHGSSWACSRFYYLEGALSREDWLIQRPPVDRPEMTDYPQYTFHPNDVYYVQAGGCVQSGGFGKTWKRYVDASGSDHDKYYYGTITIPGSADVSPGQPIGVAINHWSYIAVNAHYDPSKFHLQLGYVDEPGKYGDNGYYDHDDGTEDQCKGVGAAWVRITVEHHRAPPNAQEAPKIDRSPMDLTWDQIDDNLFPLNPKWKAQIDSGSAPEGGMLCNYFKNAGDRRDFGGCSRQDPHVDEPHPFTGFPPVPNVMYAVCHMPKIGQDDNLPDDSVHGHVNWSVATYTGKLYFEDFQQVVGFPPGDNDYDLALVRPDEAGVLAHNRFRHHEAGNRGLTLEFDSREVIDKMDAAPFWRRFHEAVDSHAGGDWTAAQAILDGRDAQVVGLLGVDTKHTFHAELHPVYAMAVKVDDDIRHETWEFFARSSGDEGGCSQDQHYIPSKAMTFFFPDTDGLVRSVDSDHSSVFAVQSTATWGQRHWEDGLTVTLSLPPLDSGGIVFGELQLCKSNCRGPEAYAVPIIAAAIASDRLAALSPTEFAAQPLPTKIDEGSIGGLKRVLTKEQWTAFASALGSVVPEHVAFSIRSTASARLVADGTTTVKRDDGIAVRRRRFLNAAEPRVPVFSSDAVDEASQREQYTRYQALKRAVGSDDSAKAALTSLQNP